MHLKTANVINHNYINSSLGNIYYPGSAKRSFQNQQYLIFNIYNTNNDLSFRVNRNGQDVYIYI